MIVKNIHEKLLNAIKIMLYGSDVKLPYYGEFNLSINFHEKESIETCAVNVDYNGMNFYYSPTFLKDLSQKEVNFVVLHENFHLLFDHPKRTKAGNFNHKISNIVQDMIINHIIWKDIPRSFVDIPKDEEGKNMALFVPKEYNGNLIFEELYEWFVDELEKWKKSNNNDDSDNPSPSYGDYGKDPSNTSKTIETFSKESIFKDLENGSGEYMDKHISDDVSSELRGNIVKNIMDRLSSRGLMSGEVEMILGSLRKRKKDHLREIKRSLNSFVFGTNKSKTISKPNRKGISGLKGYKKVSNVINCILDTSGSMGNNFETVLSYIYRSDMEINLIEADTSVNYIKKIKRKRQLNNLKIKGLGGTILQPAIDLVANEYNKYNTVVLTDGYCDSLDLSKIKHKVLIVSIGVNVPILKNNGKLKQIIVDKS